MIAAERTWVDESYRELQLSTNVAKHSRSAVEVFRAWSFAQHDDLCFHDASFGTFKHRRLGHVTYPLAARYACGDPPQHREPF